MNGELTDMKTKNNKRTIKEETVYKFIFKNGKVYRMKFIIEEEIKDGKCRSFGIKGNYTEKEKLFFEIGIPYFTDLKQYMNVVTLAVGKSFKENKYYPMLSLSDNLYNYKEALGQKCIDYMLGEAFDRDNDEDMKFIDDFTKLWDKMSIGDNDELTIENLIN